MSRRCLLLLAVLLLFACLGGGAAQADERGQYKVVDGVAVYYGLVPATIVKGHPPTHPEPSMHGGLPSGHEFHLVIALFDAATSARIEDAKVTARIAPLGGAGASRALEPMQIAGTITYGAFFPLPLGDRYVISVTVERPGASHAISVDFSYDHQRG
jgi:hypothetical protein